MPIYVIQRSHARVVEEVVVVKARTERAAVRLAQKVGANNVIVVDEEPSREYFDHSISVFTPQGALKRCSARHSIAKTSEESLRYFNLNNAILGAVSELEEKSYA